VAAWLLSSQLGCPVVRCLLAGVEVSLPAMGPAPHAAAFNDVVYTPGGVAHGVHHLLCPPVGASPVLLGCAK
jgi:hypothetical protein